MAQLRKMEFDGVIISGGGSIRASLQLAHRASRRLLSAKSSFTYRVCSRRYYLRHSQ